MTRLKFSTRDALLVMAVTALTIGWFLDHQRLSRDLQAETERRQMLDEHLARTERLLDDVEEMSTSILEVAGEASPEE